MDTNVVNFEEVRKTFPFLNRTVVADFLSGERLKCHKSDTPLYIAAEYALKKIPKIKQSSLDLNEKIIEYYDPSGEFKASNKH